MPTYEFTCQGCGHHFETFTTISKKSNIHCPQCEGRKLKESFGTFYVGGTLSNKSAGTGTRCHGSCSTCSSSCKTG